jgi:hypothetical protein
VRRVRFNDSRSSRTRDPTVRKKSASSVGGSTAADFKPPGAATAAVFDFGHPKASIILRFLDYQCIFRHYNAVSFEVFPFEESAMAEGLNRTRC